MIINEIVAERLPPFFDEIVDYSGDDPGFVSLIRTRSAEITVKIISEIEDGFNDGLEDIKKFVKAGATDLLNASAPPNKAKMAAGIAIPTMLRFMQNSWDKRAGAPPKEETPVAKPQAKPASVEPQEELKEGEQ